MIKAMGAGASLRHKPLWGYTLACASFGLALALRLQLRGDLPPGYPYLTFFPSVILTAFLAGLWPGILCAVLSGAAALYFFIPPYDSFALNTASMIALVFYVFIAGLYIALIQLMHRAGDRQHESQLVAERLYEQQRTMFQELQHRVANNMTFVSALLHLQKRKIDSGTTTAAQALEDAQSRIETLARVHRRLYDPASAELPAGEYFREICADMCDATGATNIVCNVNMADIRIDIARLTTLSLLVTELITNSLKHAFGPQGGTIALQLEKIADDKLALTVSDDGKGLPADLDIRSSKGLGSRIVTALAAQLGGEMRAAPGNGGGTTWRMEFPA